MGSFGAHYAGLYDAAMERIATLEAALAAEREESELAQATLNLVMNASSRALSAWRAEHPESREMTWPDLAEHIVWAFGRAEALAAEREARLAAERERDALREAAEDLSHSLVVAVDGVGDRCSHCGDMLGGFYRCASHCPAWRLRKLLRSAAASPAGGAGGDGEGGA